MSKRKQPSIDYTRFGSSIPPVRSGGTPVLAAVSSILTNGASNTENNEEVVEDAGALEKTAERREAGENAFLEQFRSKAPNFKDIYQKESFYIENDLQETLFEMSNGVRGGRSKFVNMALREFFESHQIEIQEFTGKYAVGNRRKKKGLAQIQTDS